MLKVKISHVLRARHHSILKDIKVSSENVVKWDRYQNFQLCIMLKKLYCMECSDKRYPESYLSTWYRTSHPAYDATSTESNGVKIDGFLYPNFM